MPGFFLFPVKHYTIKVKLATLTGGDPKAPFSIAPTPIAPLYP